MVVQNLDLGESLQRLDRLSCQELSDLVAQCAAAIDNGASCIEAYVAFVLAQQELARRFGVALSFDHPLRFPYSVGLFAAEGDEDTAATGRRVPAPEGSNR